MSGAFKVIIVDDGMACDERFEALRSVSQKVTLEVGRFLEAQVLQQESIARIPLRCPLTEKYFTFPITTSCGHTFEYKALFEYAEKTRHFGFYLFPLPCPKCTRLVSAAELKLGQAEFNAMHQVRERAFSCLQNLFRRWNTLRHQRGVSSLDLRDTEHVKKLVVSELKKSAQALKKRQELHLRLENGDLLTEEELQGVCYFIALNIKFVEKAKQKTERDILFLLQRAFQNKLLTIRDYAHLMQQLAEWTSSFEAIPAACVYSKALAEDA